MKNGFKEEDKEKVIKFLNIIAKHARFDLSTTEVIDYFHTLSYMQKELIPKINSNILEIKKVVDTTKDDF